VFCRNPQLTPLSSAQLREAIRTARRGHDGRPKTTGSPARIRIFFEFAAENDS